MTSDRRLRHDRRPSAAVFVLWLAASTVLALMARSYLEQLRFADADDVIRLLQVRDLLAGQSWWDVTQYRIAPPEGVAMHWSRLVDVPLALVMLALEPMLGAARAELAALVIVPLGILLVIMQVVGRLAWRLFDRTTAIMACLVLLLWPLLLVEMQPLRIDHHAWQIAAVAVALWAISWREPLRGGAVAGLAMAMGASVSLEILPMTAAFGLVLFLRWAVDYRQRVWLVCYMQSLAVSLVAIFALTKGAGALNGPAYCDAITLPHIGFFAVAALGTSVLGRMQRVTLPLFVLLFAGVGALAAGAMALAAPQCIASPFGSLDPLVRDLWYANVREGTPVWQQDAHVIVGKSLHMLLALGASIALVLRSRDWLRQWWIEYTLVLLVAVLAAVMTHRSFYYVGVVGCVPLGWLAASMLARLRRSGGLLPSLGAAIGIYLVLMPSAPVNILAPLLRDSAPTRGQVATAPMRSSGCGLSVRQTDLARLEPSVVFAQFDIGPFFLLNTPHKVVATGHHRADAAMRDVLQAFTASPDEARAIVERRGADYLAICPELAEARNLAEYGGPQSLMARLLADDAPGWLEKIPSQEADAIKVWRVRPDGSPSQSR